MAGRSASRIDPLQRLRDNYAHQISNNITALVETFGGLLASSQVKYLLCAYDIANPFAMMNSLPF